MVRDRPGTGTAVGAAEDSSLNATRIGGLRIPAHTARGNPVYERRHSYAGDDLDGLAVVRYIDDGLCGHVNSAGDPAHCRRYLDLDAYHKGLARARDRHGWFQIAFDGTPAYERRFAAVEPFYNGQALCLTAGFDPVVIGPDGTTLVRLVDQNVGNLHQ